MVASGVDLMTRFTQASIDQLKGRVDIGEVISERITLKKIGKDLQGLCPFHEDKKPSLTVSPGKGFYHCFSCEAHGDAIEFLMEFDKRSFSDAVTDLAKRYNVTLEVEQDGNDWAAQKAKREAQDRLRSLVATSVDFYHQQLYTPGGHPAREHVKQRGMGRAIADKYQMGWAGGGASTSPPRATRTGQ